MKIDDLPLPLRLRNALTKAGFNDADGLRDWLSRNGEKTIAGIGETGQRQLKQWAAESRVGPAERGERGGPTIIRRPARREEPDEERAAGVSHDERAEDYRRDDIPGRWSPLAGDVSMRGGLDALRKWMHVDQDDEPELRIRDLASKLDVQRAAVERAGGSTVVETDRGLLMLRLESDIQDRLRAMIPVIKGLAHVKELGVEVSAETVGRMALIRGLDALEKAHSVKNGAPKPENPPDPTPDEPVSAAEPRNGVHPTPDGWARCGPNDKIPVPEAVLHDYYTQNGWDRYWGKAGDSVIYFYWTPEMGKQGLDAFPGSDKNGRRIAVQDTPWGPGHIVPANWLNS